MGWLITLKYNIIDFFKSDEEAKDMFLLKLMKILNHFKNQARNRYK